MTENELFEQWIADSIKELKYPNSEPAILARHNAMCGWKARAELAEKKQATIVTQIDAVKFQEALDAMCVDKDKQIAKQSAEIARLKAQVALDEALISESTRTIQELEAELLSSINDGYDMAKRDYIDQNIELQAYINTLREALKRAVEDLVPHHTKPSTYKIVNEALAKTPAQSLQTHDDEVIERCAKVVEGMIEYASVIDAVRALKGKQNES